MITSRIIIEKSFKKPSGNSCFVKKRTFIFNINELGLSASKILGVMGYREVEAPESLSDLVSKILKEAVLFTPAKAEYIIVDNPEFNDADASFYIHDIVFSPGATVYEKLRGSRILSIFLATAGEDIGFRSRKAMNEGELLAGYVYDVVGSEIVGAACEALFCYFEQEMAFRGWKTTNMYSPGSCEWNVDDQHNLFRLFPDNFCNIRLTPSALMDPVKSASGFIGAGEKVERIDHKCSLCNRDDCTFRRSMFQG